MSEPTPKLVAERWTWRTVTPWIVPPLVIPIVLVLLAAGYVIYQGSN